MAAPLANVRAVGPGTTIILGAGNYYLSLIGFQLEFITATGAGFTQLQITLRCNIASAITIYSFIYDYNAAAAGTTYFNTPIIIPGADIVLPRGAGVEINLANAANITQAVMDVNLFGTSL
jgi:hypothetical protein